MPVSLINVQLNVDTEPFLEWFGKVFARKSFAPPERVNLAELNPWLLRRGKTDFVELRKHCPGKIVAIANLKGGVGKSTLAANLGAAVADTGKRVLLVDLDWQESLSRLTLTIDDALHFARNGVPLIARVLETYARNPYQPEWAVVHAAAEGALVRRKCARGGELVVLPTSNVLQIAEELAMMSHFWNAKRNVPTVGEAQQRADAIYDSRFIVAEMLSIWGRNFDCVIADCPPRLTTASIGALAASDVILMPAQNDPVALNGVTLFVTKFLSQFTEVLWGGLDRVPRLVIAMNHVVWNGAGRARRSAKLYVEGLEDQSRLTFTASQAVIPSFAGFGRAAEDKSKDVRAFAIDDPKGKRARDQFAVLASEIEEL